MSLMISNNLNKFLSILILTLLLTHDINCGSITGDKENKILVMQPNKDVAGQTIQFRFQLSSQLFTQQFIAVKFPESFAGNLGFDRVNRFACELQDVTNNIQIQTQSVPSAKHDSNIAFCQLIDNITVLSGGITYKHSLILHNVKLSSSNYMNNISIFTATDSSPMRLIIDSSNFFGQIGLYSDWTSQKTALSILSASVVSPNSVNIYDVFDLSVTFIVNALIPKDSIILFKWPSQFLYRPHSCSNLKISDGDINKAALSGNILCSLMPGTDDTFVLNGLMEDLTALRQFLIIFRNFQALDQLTTTNQNFEVNVYYKNSYSVLGYDSSAVFQINPARVTNLSITHPDNLSIYANAAWPLIVSFSIDTTLPKGGYVLIQLSNYSATTKLNFVASTCDFSGSASSVSEYFGQRPVCSPLAPYSANSGMSGNGMFFKLNKIWAGMTYNINVFAFAEACGLSQLSQSTNSFVTFQYVLTVYRDIDMTQQNQNRLIYPSNKILVQSSPISSTNLKCFNNFQLVNSVDPESLYFANFKGSSIDNIIFNELHNFSFSNFATPSCSGSNPCYLNDILSNNGAYTQSYIETDDPNRSVTGSYFNIRADIPFGIHTNPLMRYLVAVPIFIDPVTLQIQTQPGQLELHLNSAWITPGDVGSCYASWGSVWETQNPDFSYSALNTPSASQTVLTNTFDLTNLNFISQATSTIDSQSFSTPYTINSVVDLQGFTRFKFLKDREVQCNTRDQCNALNFSVFSSCFKFANPLPNILSQYAYFDFQFNFYYTSSSTVNRINRFFKFVNNAIGFLDVNKVNTYTSNIFTYHYSVFPNSDNNNAICLLQIYQEALLNNLDNSANTLIIYLNNIFPIDVDYSNVSSTYPALPNGDLSGVYSFPTRKLNSDISLFTSRLELYQNAYYTNYLSTYYTYLSPYIMFTNTGVNNLNQDVLIPTYCPSSDNFSFSAVWYQGNLDSFTNMKKVSSTLAMQDPNNPLVSRLQIMNMTGSKTPINLTTIYNTSVFLPKYSPTDRNDKIYFSNGSSNTNCSGFSLLLNGLKLTAMAQNQLSINSSVLPGFTYSSQYMFYAFGKKFNTFIFSVNDSSLEIPQTTQLNLNMNNLNYFFTGIQRPTLDMFLDSSGNPSINDRIAFFCASNVLTESGLLSNLNYINLDYSFKVLFNLDNTTSWPNISISRDSTDVNYSQDPTSNVILQLQTPILVSTNAVIYFRLYTNNFSDNSVCTMILNSLNVDCNIINYKTYENSNQLYSQCPVPIVTNTFTIACYNIVMNSATLVIDNITVSIADNYFIQVVNSDDSRLTYVNPNYQANYPLTNDSAYVSDFSYVYNNQQYSFVKGVFTVNLPRGIVRGSQLTIQGDFSKFFSNSNISSSFSILDYLPLTCSVIVGNSEDISNIFVESCDLSNAVSNLWQTSQSITVNFKNFIYEPNLNLNNTLFISIYPIIANNLIPSGVSASFTVSWVLPDDVPIADSSTTSLTWSNSNFFITFNPIFQDLLCSVSTIDPILTNEETRMNFLFDLDTNWKNIQFNPATKGFSPNEFLIHFDDTYISLGDAIICSAGNSLIKLYCSNIGDNILSIKVFDFSLRNFRNQIQVSGIIIRSLFTNKKNNYRFLCSINNIDSNGNRVSLINGLGIIYPAVTEPKLNGGLMIYDVTTPNWIIRASSSLTITFGFDRTNSLTTLPNILQNNPYFLAVLPVDYQLINLNNIFSCSMSIFTSASASALYPLSQTLNINGCSLYGANSILVDVADDSIIISNSFRYFQLTISNIKNPVEPSPSVGNFKIVISNESYDYIYRSYPNLSTSNYNLLPKSLSVNINYYRGLSYTLSRSLIKLDVIDKSNNNIINYLTIKPGRYQIFSIGYDKVNNDFPYEEAGVQLEDGKFKIYESPLIVNTLQTSFDFHVGTSCSTPNGVYYTNLILPTSKYFHNYIAITILVQGTIGGISLAVPSSVDTGSSVPVPITFTDLTYEYINIYFTPDVNNDMANTLPNTVVVPPFTQTIYATFSTVITSEDSQDQFGVSTDSKCFNLNNNNVIFNLSQKVTVVSNVTLTESNFVYSSNQYAQITGKNSIWIDFVPPVDSGIITCALICYLNDCPSDVEIVNRNIEDTPLINLFSSSFSHYNSTIIKFDNLIRGEQYKLKCVLQYMQSGLVSYSIEDITIDEFDDKMQTTINTFTNCIEFNFASQIDKIFMRKVLDYCQDLYRDKDGCIICADNYGNLPDGVKFSSQTTCSYNINDSRGKSYGLYNTGTYLESNYMPLYSDSIVTTIPSSNINVNSTVYALQYPNTFPYLVCAVQDKICNSDLPDSVLSETINFFQYSLSNEYMVSASLGVKGVNVINSYLRTDQVKPVITSLASYIIGDPYIDTTGYFKIKINFNVPLLCYWKLDGENTSLTQYDILMCSDSTKCGSTRINQIVTDIYPYNTQSLSFGKYNLYVFCYNDLPNPLNNSDIISLFLFDLSSAPGMQPSDYWVTTSSR